jgi:signal transduction histidine kinase
LSWLLQTVACTLALFVIFAPTAAEFGYLLLVDIPALFLALAIDRPFFLRCHPASAAFFPVPGFEREGATLTPAEKVALYRELVTFPARRAWYCYCVNLAKMVPGALVILFYWHRSISLVAQGSLLFGYVLVLMLFFHGAVFLELHQFVSRKIAEYHRRFDLSEAFRTTPIGERAPDFIRQQELTLVGIIGMIIFLQVVVLRVGSRMSDAEKEVAVLAIGGIGIALAGRIWVLGRRYFIHAMRDISHHFETLDLRDEGRATVALHTSGFLARFEKTFNDLVARLRDSEQESARWHLTEVEQSRYRALGEISGLIAHDLSTPLHVIQFCATEFKERPDGVRIPKYVDNLIANTGRAIDLVNSIKAFLKNPARDHSGVVFGQAHGYVLRLLATQFSQSGFAQVRFSLAPELEGLSLAISRSDLIHVLYNLYKNSVENFLAHARPDPAVDLGLIRIIDGKAEIRVRDNGTGLDSQSFERMTAYKLGADPEPSMASSLGLRLVRRLVERYGGALSLQSKTEVPGTEYSLVLSIL